VRKLFVAPETRVSYCVANIAGIQLALLLLLLLLPLVLQINSSENVVATETDARWSDGHDGVTCYSDCETL